MYSDFTPESGYVYVVNGRNEPVAIISFSETAARPRKQFERERKAARKRAHLAQKPKSGEGSMRKPGRVCCKGWPGDCPPRSGHRSRVLV
jgi:hypothetical protein